MCLITNWQLSVCLYSVVRCRNPQCHRVFFFCVRFFQGTADDDDVYNAANTLKRIAVLSR